MESYYAVGYEKGKKIVEEQITEDEDKMFHHLDRVQLFGAVTKLRNYLSWQNIFKSYSNGKKN